MLVLAVNFKEPAARALQFAQASALRLPLLLDTSGQVARSLDVKVFPTTLTVSSQGQPRHRLRGEVDWASPAARHLVTSLFAR